MTKSTKLGQSGSCRKFAGKVKRFATDSRGAIAVLFVVISVPIIIAVTAAVDLNNAVRIKWSLQAAADSGVLAAATALASGYDDSDKKQIALDTFFANLSPQLLKAFPTSPDVSIDFPTQTIHMDVQAKTDQLLTNFIVSSMTVGVQATAMVEKGSPICMMALNSTAWKGLDIQGTANLVADGCAVHANSRHEEAMRQNGGGTAVADSFCVHGDYSGSNYQPKPNRYCMHKTDPLAEKFAADLAAHGDITTCREDNPGTVKDNTEYLELSPGVYCGGLTLQQGKVRLLPGVHVFRDGELNISAQSWLEGEGVTILLAGDDTTRITTQAGANLSLSAPSSGLFSGIAIAQHPDSKHKNKDNTIVGGGYVKIDGIVYFPTQPLKITGNGEIGSDSSQFAIIADTIAVEGNGVLTIKIGADYKGAGLPELPEANQIVRLVH
jgi:Flp pilus assembly protein TadG